MTRVVPILAAFGLVLGAGAWNAMWTDRFNWSVEPQASAARMDGVPKEISGWTSQDQAMNPREIRVAGVARGLSRLYEKPDERHGYRIILLCGRPGPVSVHTPEVCYVMAGHEMLKQPERVAVSLPEGKAEFKTATFRKISAGKMTLVRLYWAWAAEGDWTAPDNPRWEFANRRALFKLYVIRDLDSADEPIADDPSQDFIRLLLPELKQSLFARSSNG